MELQEFFAQVHKCSQQLNQSENHEALVSDMRARLFSAFDYLRGGLTIDQAFLLISYLLLIRFLNVLQDVTANTPDEVTKQATRPFAILPEWQNEIHLNPDTMLEELLANGRAAAYNYMHSMPILSQNILTACQGHIGRHSLSPNNILAAAHLVEGLPLSPKQTIVDKIPAHIAALGAAYEQTLSSSLSRARTVYEPSPKALVRLMVGLANPQAGEQIYDPACGSAGLLIETLQQGSGNKALGIDINPDACTIGVLNLLLHGYSDVLILQRNALEPYPLPFLPNVILAHTPFGGEVTPGLAEKLAEQVHLFVKTRELDLAFLLHIIAQVKQGARAVITLPEGVLFRNSNAEVDIRRYLVEEQLLEAVISLPLGLFMPSTSIKGNLLVLAPTSRHKNIWFYAFEEKRRTKEPLSELEIALCLEDFAKAMTSRNLGGRGWTRSTQELAKNNYNLQAKPPIRRDNQLNLPPDLTTQPLQTVALLVDRGISHLREQTIYQDEFEQLLERAENEESRKATQAKWKLLIRVGDLTFGRVQKTEQLIDVTTIKRQADISYIQSGDVLLSVDSDIGKVAICTSRQEGMAFSSRLVRIRCSENLLPDFLAEYLRSSFVQDTLQNLASGSLGPRVQLSDIKQIPIPSLSIAQQREILKKMEAGTALLAALRELFINNEVGVEDPSTAFITHLIRDNAALQTLVAFQEKRENLSPDEVYQWLDRQAARIHTLRNSLIREPREGEGIAFIDATLESLSLAIDRLRLALSVPTIQERLDELDRIQVSLRRHLSQLPFGYEESQVARFLDQAVAGMEAALFALSEPLLASMRISVRFEPDILPLHEDTLIQIIVENSGPVSANDIKVEIPALAGILTQGEKYSVIRISKLMPQEGKHEKTYHVFSDKATLIKSRALWVAKDVHGGQRQGEVPISFSFVDSPRKYPYIPISRNPYITGTPVRGQEMFFGREDVIDFLKANLLGAHQNNVLLLEGNRRTGKSSVLKQVERGKLLEGAIPVYIDCQGFGELTEQKLFFKIAHHIANSLQRSGIQIKKPQSTDINPDDAFWDFRQILEQYLTSTAEKHIILLFDEFEYLDIAIKDEKLPERVMENLRHVFQHYDRLGVVLTGSHRLIKLREEYWSILFGLTLRKDIGALDRQAAEELVTKPLQSFVQFTPEAVAYIVELAACQPYFIQMIAHTLVSDLQQKQDTSLIIPVRIEAIVPSAIEAASEHLQYMVNHAKLARQKTILAYIAKQQNIDTPVTHQDLTNFLSIQGIASSASLLAQDLELLRENDLIVMVRGGPQSLYRIPIELLRYWIQDHIDLDDVVARAVADV